MQVTTECSTGELGRRLTYSEKKTTCFENIQHALFITCFVCKRSTIGAYCNICIHIVCNSNRTETCMIGNNLHQYLLIQNSQNHGNRFSLGENDYKTKTH